MKVLIPSFVVVAAILSALAFGGWGVHAQSAASWPFIGVQSVKIDTATSGNVELVALTSGQSIYVLHWDVMASGTTSFQLIYGTGTACATGETDLTGPYPLIAQTGLSVGDGYGALMKSASGNALCLENSAAVQVNGIVTYVKF
jgi:hypothetical protein